MVHSVQLISHNISSPCDYKLQEHLAGGGGDRI
jgi:hypothetical protein